MNFLLSLFVFFLYSVRYGETKPSDSKLCGYSKKLLSNGDCVSLDNTDVLKGVHFLASPPTKKCKKVTTSQNIPICEDNLPAQCNIWSVMGSERCDGIGNMEFEKFWSKKGCTVTIFHYNPRYRGNECSFQSVEDHPNIQLQRYDMWGGRCFTCFYNTIKAKKLTTAPDILKVQRRDVPDDEYDGLQFSILSDLFLHQQDLMKQVSQIVFTVSINSRTLIDFVGREAEHAWNMWATQRLVSDYAAISVVAETGPHKLKALQFDDFLEQVELSPENVFYHVSFLKLAPNEISDNQAKFQAWQPKPPRPMVGKVPSYCAVPSTYEDQVMQKWIKAELRVRCHPTQLAVPCESGIREYDAFSPCRQELMDDLAEDYAISKSWCDFKEPGAAIPALQQIDKEAYQAFRNPPLPHSMGVRLAFFFTVYTDYKFTKRMFDHLYSPKHYYLYHVDPSGASKEFENQMRELSRQHKNVYISMDVPIVYGASTATIVLTKAMAWFNRHATGWDYFVPLTGSDYPLIPLERIEKIFACQNPPMPFVMAWTPGTSTHLFRLGKTHPVFESNAYLAKSMKAVTDERGSLLGAVPMEYRSGNFGPPVFCNKQSTFYHLHNRFNKSGKVYDTQWLFPRDIFPQRGRAIAEERPDYSTPSFDKVWRVWKKSDPATTGAYDKESVNYITNSEEGRKYWHFFKQMLLGSEEHYYASLLYNWPRTRAFVQTLSAETVWNTWELGLWERSPGFQTHTHFLTEKEMDILKGFSLRGMMFGRKFSTKKTPELLDRIDREILFNKSFESGLYWPGFYYTDITTYGKVWVKMLNFNRSVKGSVYKMKQDDLAEYYSKIAWDNINRTDTFHKCPTILAVETAGGYKKVRRNKPGMAGGGGGGGKVGGGVAGAAGGAGGTVEV
jgi:hypothetical protein